MKYTTLTIIVALLAIAGCESESADGQQAKDTAKMASEANAQVGMPGIANFQERKLVKMIYELRDREDLITYTYIVDMMGELHFLTKSIGYGVPYSTQFSNPERLTGRTGITLPQPEPNGLFMPTSSSATWIVALDEDGETRPLYVEPQIIVSPFPLDG